VHLENMLKLARMGVSIVPPMPAFYNHPQTVDDIVNQTVGRTFDLFGLDAGAVQAFAGRVGAEQTPPKREFD